MESLVLVKIEQVLKLKVKILKEDCNLNKIL